MHTFTCQFFHKFYRLPKLQFCVWVNVFLTQEWHIFKLMITKNNFVIDKLELDLQSFFLWLLYWKCVCNQERVAFFHKFRRIPKPQILIYQNASLTQDRNSCIQLITENKFEINWLDFKLQTYFYGLPLWKCTRNWREK